MNNTQLVIYHILTTIAATLLLGEGILLLLRGRKNKARRILAYISLFFGVIYLYRSISLYLNNPYQTNSYLRIETLIGGLLYIASLFLFPLEIMIPGWLNKKRTLLLFAPIILLSLIYMSGLLIFKQKVETLTSIYQLKNSFWHFNVWFRLVFFILGTVYIPVFMKQIYSYEDRHIKWENDHFSDQEQMNIMWLRSSDFIVLLIYFAWLLLVFPGCYWCAAIHTVIIICCSSYLFYKALLYESPYPEKFFIMPRDEQQAEIMDNETNILE